MKESMTKRSYCHEISRGSRVCNLAFGLSELVTQRQLYSSRGVENCVAATAGLSEGTAGGIAISCTEGVPVEGVGYIHLEGDELRFRQGGAFDNGEILVHIAGISNAAEKIWQVTKGIAALRDQVIAIGIQQSGAVKVIIAAVGCERAVWMRGTTAVRSQRIV
jgi:hypothetical protein